MARDYFFAFGSGNPSTNASLAPTFIVFVNNAGTTFAAPSIAERYPGSGLYYVSYGATQTMAFVMDGATSGLATSDRYISGVFDPYDQFGVTLNAAYAFGATGFALESIGNSFMAGMGLTLVGQGLTITVMGNSMATMGNSLSVMGVSLSTMGNSLSVMGGSLSAIGTTLFGMGGSLSVMGGSLSVMGTTLLGMGISLNGLAGVLGTTASSYGSTGTSPTDIMGFLIRARELAEGNQTYTKATGVLDLYVRGGITLLAEKTISDTSTNTTKT